MKFCLICGHPKSIATEGRGIRVWWCKIHGEYEQEEMTIQAEEKQTHAQVVARNSSGLEHIPL